ncbi:ABC transporter G family member 23 [Orchesella cincta]|uniref:ABC transporter G family member 23 n=1 Tax=Orchesella cincta TaxID=48709 RepID=A0A1D2N590_ORCCI|nr:ABC transporter G family member 23 [Orchesella cincta]
MPGDTPPPENGNENEDPRFVSVCHVNPAFANPEEITAADPDDPIGEGESTRSVSSIEDLENTVPKVNGNGIDLPPVYENRVPNPAVVVVRNAHKSYSSGTPVLSEFNMTVEKGTIYGLLGSSGCGKTTILSCIVGVRRLDSGTIHVFGNRPGEAGSGVPGKNVGYMPQDISLYGDFTIGETLTYFGSLYCMTKSAIETNRDWLVEFLALPEPKRRVGTLSGGQKRRVSIAVAMIHDPQLLILDEPTVGVDPLLRESIWEHLVERVTKNNTTVIITTHYIEEARNSNAIGLMRNGKLLAEKPPDELMREHNATLLEDVVLKLCRKDTDETSDLTDGRKNKLGDLEAHYGRPKAIQENYPTMAQIDAESAGGSLTDAFKRVLTLGHKNAMVLIRNYLLLIFILWVPAAQVLFMCLALGNDPKPMKFGIVNHEFEATGLYTCAELLEVRKNETCSLVGLSCEYLNTLPGDVVHQRFYKTEEEARYAVQRGKIWGFMSFPEEFSSAYYTKIASSALADEETLNGSSIALEMDETSKQISGTLKKQFGDSFKDFTKALLGECGYNERLAELPLQIIDPIYGSDDTDTREFMSCGIMIAILFFFPLITAGIQYIYEKKLGTLERTLVAGVNTWEIMAGFSITTSFILFIQTMLALMIVTVLFQITVVGSFVLCVILGILVGLGGVSMGFLIGSFCKEEVEATMLSIAMFFPVVMLSGIMWPLEGMPIGFQYFSYLLPCQLPSEAMRSIVSRGWDFSHSHVWPGFASIVGWIIFYWILTIFLHKKNLVR